MNELEKLTANVEIMLGRLNALHTTMHMLVRTNGQPPERTAAVLLDAARRVEAGALAAPIPERTLEEMQRVLTELSHVAQLRAQEVAQTP